MYLKMSAINFNGAAVSYIGTSSTSVVIGENASSVGINDVVIGFGATGTQTGVVIGKNAYTAASNSIAIGHGASNVGVGTCFAVGYNAYSNPPAGQANVIGAHSSSEEDFSIAIGSGSTPGSGAVGARIGVVIGSGSSGAGHRAIAIGDGITASNNETCIRNIFGASGGGQNVFVTAAGLLNTNTSSIATKHNLRKLESLDILQDQFKPVRFTFNATGEESIGLLAEYVHELVPEICPLDQDRKPYNIRYDLLSVILLRAVRDLHTEIKSL